MSKNFSGSRISFNGSVAGLTIINGDLVMGRNGEISGLNVITGSCITASVTRKIEKSFSELDVSGPVTVDLVIGSDLSVKVVGDDNLINFIETEIVGETLNISVKEGVGFSTTQSLNVQIVAPIVTLVELRGSGDINLTGLNQETLAIEVTGSGDVRASGKVQSVDLRLQGSGDIDTCKLKATVGKIKLQGSGDVKAFVSGAVKVRLKGSGDVYVIGNPVERDSICQGSGDIEIN